MDLVVGAEKLDRTLQDVEALVDSYRTDDGLRHLDYRPLTPPDRMVPEDLAVTILTNSRVAGTASKPSRTTAARSPLDALPGCALEDSDDGERQAVHFVALTQISRSPEGRAYYERKRAQGRTTKEAIRCLKRRISDRIFVTLRASMLTQELEWAVVRRYMSPESLAKARLEVIDGDASEEVRGELVAAS